MVKEKPIYLAHYDPLRGICITIRAVNKQHAESARRMVPESRLSEVGPITWWLMKHGWPRLAMLPYWR